MKNYYTLLGVTRTASSDEIKRAFRRLAVKYHPDKNPDPRAAEFFKEVTEAYNILSDWEERKKYDLRWENPFGETIQQKQKSKENDPRYRTKRPPGAKPYRRPYTTTDLMRDYLPYLRMFSYAGLLFSLLLVLDLFLPYEEKLEHLEKTGGRTRTRQEKFFSFQTTSGSQVKVYSEKARFLLKEDEIRITETAIFRTVMNISDKGPTLLIEMGYIYKTLVFFPLILLLSSLIGATYRKNIAFPFNLGIVSGIFLLLTAAVMVLL